MKKRIRLTESKLRRLIESTINEIYGDLGAMGDGPFGDPQDNKTYYDEDEQMLYRNIGERWKYDEEDDRYYPVNTSEETYERDYWDLEKYMEKLDDDDLRDIIKNPQKYSRDAVEFAKEELVHNRKDTPEHLKSDFDSWIHNEQSCLNDLQKAEDDTIQPLNVHNKIRPGAFAMAALKGNKDAQTPIQTSGEWMDKFEPWPDDDPWIKAGRKEKPQNYWDTWSSNRDYQQAKQQALNTLAQRNKYDGIQSESRRRMVNRLTESVIRKLRRR